MRSSLHSSQRYLASEAHRRPEIAKAMSDIKNLTREDVMAVPVSLPWVRKALLELHTEVHAQIEAARLSQLVDEQVDDRVTPDISGRIIRYTGPQAYLTYGSNSVEVRTDKLLFIAADGGVWFDTVYWPGMPQGLAGQFVEVEPAERMAYIARYRAELAREHVVVDQVIDLTPPNLRSHPMARLAGLGVTVR